MTFTIVVPTYNESRDIDVTCEALLRLTPEPEIIFVDDASTDDTADLIQRRLNRPSMKLIRQPSNRGQGAARNAGVRAATGEILVFVDADVLLPPDFLRRLSRHYERGADYVAVEASVSNTKSVYARFFQAQHQHWYGGDKPVGWSQGFSCRRSLALKAGLFTEVFPAVGEDGEFVVRLSQETSKGVTDKTIVVRHTVPETMRDFWGQWEGRGIALPLFRHEVHHVRGPFLIAERIAAGLWSLLFVLTIVPVARRAVAFASLSERRWADLPSFLTLSILQVLANRIGEWKGVFRLYSPAPSDAG